MQQYMSLCVFLQLQEALNHHISIEGLLRFFVCLLLFSVFVFLSIIGNVHICDKIYIKTVESLEHLDSIL